MIKYIRPILDYVLWQYALVALSTGFCFIAILSVNPDLLTGFLLFFIISFGVFGFNSLNNIFDFELDKVNKPLRPLPSGRISLSSAKIITLFLFFICSLLSLFFSFKTFLVSLIYPLFAFIYSYHKIGFRRWALSNFLAGGILHTLIPVLLIFTIFPLKNHYFVLLFFVLFGAITITKDFEDIEGDKLFRLNPLLRIMSKNTLLLAIMSIYFVFVLITILLVFFSYLPSSFFFPSIIAVLPTILMIYFYKFHLLVRESIVTQSKLVNYSMITIILIQISYALNLFF